MSNLLFNAIFTEACESWKRDSINGPESLTHLFRACFAEHDPKPAWSALAEICVAQANAQGKPDRDGLLDAWMVFEHHVYINPVEWVGVETYDEDGAQVTPDEVAEIRDEVADLLIQDFVALHQGGDTEALRFYGESVHTPPSGVYWSVMDSRRDSKIEDSKRLIRLLDQDTGEWISEIEKIKNGPCVVKVQTEHGIVAQAEYAARETLQ